MRVSQRTGIVGADLPTLAKKIKLVVLFQVSMAFSPS